MNYNLDMNIGKIRVALKEVALSGIIGMIDELNLPYLKMKCGGKVIKSRIAEKKESSPKRFTWWDKWEWKINGTHNLSIELYDKDVTSADHFLGKTTINLKRVLQKGQVKGWFRLYRFNTLSAKLKLEIKFEKDRSVDIKSFKELPYVDPGYAVLEGTGAVDLLNGDKEKLEKIKGQMRQRKIHRRVESEPVGNLVYELNYDLFNFNDSYPVPSIFLEGNRPIDQGLMALE